MVELAVAGTFSGDSQTSHVDIEWWLRYVHTGQGSRLSVAGASMGSGAGSTSAEGGGGGSGGGVPVLLYPSRSILEVSVGVLTREIGAEADDEEGRRG